MCVCVCLWDSENAKKAVESEQNIKKLSVCDSCVYTAMLRVYVVAVCTLVGVPC